MNNLWSRFYVSTSFQYLGNSWPITSLSDSTSVFISNRKRACCWVHNVNQLASRQPHHTPFSLFWSVFYVSIPLTVTLSGMEWWSGSIQFTNWLGLTPFPFPKAQLWVPRHKKVSWAPSLPHHRGSDKMPKDEYVTKKKRLTAMKPITLYGNLQFWYNNKGKKINLLSLELWRLKAQDWAALSVQPMGRAALTGLQLGWK